MKSIVCLLMYALAALQSSAQTGCFARYANSQVRQKIISSTYSLGTDFQSAQVQSVINNNLTFLANAFGIAPNVMYFDEGNNMPNAYFETKNIGGNKQYSIYIGKKLVSRTIFIGQDFSYAALATVLAHEFAHATIEYYKNSFAIDYSFYVIDENGLRKPDIRKNELMADYVAGCFLCHRQMFTWTNTGAVVMQFYEMGDFEYNNEESHGTPADRVACVNDGYAAFFNAIRAGAINIPIGNVLASAYQYVNWK